MNFIGRKISINNTTIGDHLKNLRQEKNLNIETVAQKINIKKEYLEALENNNYEKLTEVKYKKIFLKKYCKFLGLNWEKIKNEASKKIKNKKHFSFHPKSIKEKDLIIFPKIIKNILIFLAISVFFVYIGFYIKTNLSPPKINIIQPEKDLITNKNFITVKGKTNPKNTININEESVLNNEEGYFEQTIHLKKGINNINISAQKKYGPKTTKKRQILLE